MDFVEGLYDADDLYYFGFANTGADTEDLRKALENALEPTEFEVVEDTDRDLPEYHARRRTIPPAVSPETFKLHRNRHNLPESTAYQSNLEFPTHPECDWLLEANIEQREQEQLEQMLGKIPFEVIVLHIPPCDKLDH